jgi:RNA polymerase sigma factor (sigma-70 family)
MTTSGGASAQRPEELHLLIASYREDAIRLARHLVRSTAEAEDLTQTAILNVLRRAENISDAAHVRAYLLAAVRNAWRNSLRAKGNRRFLGTDAAEQVPSEEVEPDERVITELDGSVARAAFESLSGTSREVIQLRYLEGLGFPELARRLSITPVAARQRAHRAREELVGACMDQAARAATGHCQSTRLRLGRYHRGLLSRKVRAEVQAHLDRCTACHVCYEQLIDLYGHRIGRSAVGESET